MFLVLIVAAAISVVSVRGQCACDNNGSSAYCKDLSLTTIPNCVPSNITTLTIGTPSIPLVKETMSRFKDLKGLSIVYIEDPQLAKNLLEGHPYLEYFGIISTSLSYVDNEWFMYSPRIRSMNLQTNKITSLPADTFSYLPLLEQMILANNQLTIIPPELFVGTAVTDVNLYDNPWSCDCEMATFVQWAKDNGVTIMEWSVCANPPELAGKKLINLTPDLGCKK